MVSPGWWGRAGGSLRPAGGWGGAGTLIEGGEGIGVDEKQLCA